MFNLLIADPHIIYIHIHSFIFKDTRKIPNKQGLSNKAIIECKLYVLRCFKIIKNTSAHILHC